MRSLRPLSALSRSIPFFIFREAALKDKVSGQVSSAGQPDASLSQAFSRLHHSTPLYHHYHPTFLSAALSHSCSGNFCPVLSPAGLWDQMRFSHHTSPPKKQPSAMIFSPCCFPDNMLNHYLENSQAKIVPDHMRSKQNKGALEHCVV